MLLSGVNGVTLGTTAGQNVVRIVDTTAPTGSGSPSFTTGADSVVTHLESVSSGRHHAEDENRARFLARWTGQIVPDELARYVEDGALRLDHDGHFAIRLRVAPELGWVVDAGDRTAADDAAAERGARRDQELLTLRRELARAQAALASALAGDIPDTYAERSLAMQLAVAALTPGVFSRSASAAREIAFAVPKACSSARPCLSSLAVVVMVISMPRSWSMVSYWISGKMICSLMPSV